jgi:hypothetical protein
MKLARISILVSILAIVVTAVLSGTTVNGAHVARPEPRPHPPLSGGASSVDELLGKFVAARAAHDRDALEALRVDELEYRKIIMPGSAEPGRAPQKLSPAADEYFWQSLNGKSTYHRQGLLHAYGGRRYEIRDVQWQKGIKDHLWFRCYDRLELTVVDDGGAEHVIATGSVAEVDGRFKFISFIRD